MNLTKARAIVSQSIRSLKIIATKRWTLPMVTVLASLWLFFGTYLYLTRFSLRVAYFSVPTITNVPKETIITTYTDKYEVFLKQLHGVGDPAPAQVPGSSQPQPTTVNRVTVVIDKLRTKKDEIEQQLGQKLFAVPYVSKFNILYVQPALELLTTKSCDYYSKHKTLCLINQTSLYIVIGLVELGGILYVLLSPTLRFNQKLRGLAKVQLLAMYFVGIYVAAVSFVFYNLTNKAYSDIAVLVRDLNAKSFKTAVYGSEAIKTTLHDTKIIPHIVEATSDKALLTTLITENRPMQTFYNQKVLAAIISNYLDQYQPLSVDAFLADDVLYVRAYAKTDLELLTPELAKNVINKEYDAYEINVNKAVDFSYVSELDYQTYRKQKMDEFKQGLKNFVATLYGEINKINQVMAHNSGVLSDVDKALKKVNDYKKKYVDEPNATYKKYCKNGYEKYLECVRLKNQIEFNKSVLSQYQTELEQTKKSAQAKNQELQTTKNKFLAGIAELQNQIELIEKNPVNTESELGVFFPNDSKILIKYKDDTFDGEAALREQLASITSLNINVLYDYLAAESFSNYLATTIHEYLHHLTSKDSSNLPTYFEEAQTEYFTITAMENMLTDITNLKAIGYPDEIKIFGLLLSKLDQKAMAAIYFKSKDIGEFKKLAADTIKDFNYEEFNKKQNILFYSGIKDPSGREKVMVELTQMLTK